VPVTVCIPSLTAVHVEATHEPSGEIVNVVDAVTFPRSLPEASKPSALYTCDADGAIVPLAGERTKVTGVPNGVGLGVLDGVGVGPGAAALYVAMIPVQRADDDSLAA